MIIIPNINIYDIVIITSLSELNSLDQIHMDFHKIFIEKQKCLLAPFVIEPRLFDLAVLVEEVYA